MTKLEVTCGICGGDNHIEHACPELPIQCDASSKPPLLRGPEVGAWYCGGCGASNLEPHCKYLKSLPSPGVFPRDNALELARSGEVLALAWRAGFGNETLKHPDQALLAQSFLAVAAELDYRDGGHVRITNEEPSTGESPTASRQRGDGSPNAAPDAGALREGKFPSAAPVAAPSVWLTPRTDLEPPVYQGFPSTVSREFARKLERELSSYRVVVNAAIRVCERVPLWNG